SLGTLRASIAHDLAFARFLRGEYAEAAALHERRLAEAANDDQVCASAYGLVLALHRLGDEAGVRRVLARIPPDMDVVERRDEHRVLRSLSGQPAPEGPTAEPGSESAATIGYGLAQERLFAGDRDGAVRRLREVVEGTPWAAFGHVAAEADLADPSRLDGNGARGR